MAARQDDELLLSVLSPRLVFNHSFKHYNSGHSQLETANRSKKIILSPFKRKYTTQKKRIVVDGSLCNTF